MSSDLSVVCDVRAPYSGGLTLRGYFSIWQLIHQNHEDRPRGSHSPPLRGLNRKG